MSALGWSKILIVSGVSSTSLYTSVVGNKFLKENLTSLISSIQPLISSSPSSSTKKPEVKTIKKGSKESDNKNTKRQTPQGPCESSSPNFLSKLLRALRPCRPKELKVNLIPEEFPQTKRSR